MSPIKSIILAITAAFVLAAGGCSDGPPAPSSSQLTTLSQRARETAQSNATAIQNNAQMSNDEKAQLLAHINQHPVIAPE